MNELVNEASTCMNRVEDRLKNLLESLKRLEEKSEVSPAAENIAENSNIDITDDLKEVKNSLQKLRDARQDFYRYTFAQNRQKTFSNMDEIKQLAAVMTSFEQRIGDFIRQCEKLETIRQNLEKFSADDTLNELLKKTEENLTKIDTCDRKIRDTADTAAANFENIKIELDKRINNALTLEREFLISCRELNNTTKNLTETVNDINSQQKPNIDSLIDYIASAIDSLYNKMNYRLQNIEEKVDKATAPPEPSTVLITSSQISSNEKIFEDICLKIYERISEKENAVMYNEVKASKLTLNEAMHLKTLNPSIYQKILTYVRGINHFLKIYTDIKKFLEKADQ